MTDVLLVGMSYIPPVKEKKYSCDYIGTKNRVYFGNAYLLSPSLDFPLNRRISHFNESCT
jgi:hypothetical protein